MKIAYRQNTNGDIPANSKDIIFDLTSKAIYARGVEFKTKYDLATESTNGLMSANDKKIIKKAVVIKDTTNGITTITNTNDEEIYPKTTAKAVIINNTNLEDYLNSTRIILDDRPTKDSQNGVKSGGVYSEIEEVVGAIYTNLKQI